MATRLVSSAFPLTLPTLPPQDRIKRDIERTAEIVRIARSTLTLPIDSVSFDHHIVAIGRAIETAGVDKKTRRQYDILCGDYDCLIDCLNLPIRARKARPSASASASSQRTAPRLTIEASTPPSLSRIDRDIAIAADKVRIIQSRLGLGTDLEPLEMEIRAIGETIDIDGADDKTLRQYEILCGDFDCLSERLELKFTKFVSKQSSSASVPATAPRSDDSKEIELPSRGNFAPAPAPIDQISTQLLAQLEFAIALAAQVGAKEVRHGAPLNDSIAQLRDAIARSTRERVPISEETQVIAQSIFAQLEFAIVQAGSVRAPVLDDLAPRVPPTRSTDQIAALAKLLESRSLCDKWWWLYKRIVSGGDIDFLAPEERTVAIMLALDAMRISEHDKRDVFIQLAARAKIRPIIAENWCRAHLGDDEVMTALCEIALNLSVAANEIENAMLKATADAESASSLGHLHSS